MTVSIKSRQVEGARGETGAYDSLGRRTSITRGNGASTSFTYDNVDRLTALTQNLAATASDVTLGWSYNPASQALTRTVSNAVYDRPAQLSVTRNFTYDGLNRDQAVAVTPGGYDVRGNLTYDGTRTFTYDLENRLLTVSGATATSLAYDPPGRLRMLTEGSTATGMLYDGDRLSAEYDGVSGPLLRRYVHGPGVDEPLVWYEGSGVTDRRWLHADNQGSVIAWSNGSGASGETYAYGPYGETQAWTGSRFRYTGQAALPAARLYHYKARAYDPQAGRFMQTDPIGYDDDLNLYGYVKGDPINLSDPTGLEAATLTYALGEGRADSLKWAEGAWPTWYIAATGVTAGAVACEVGCPAVVGAYRTYRFAKRLDQVRDKLKGWKETPNKKGEGSRFQDPSNKGNRVRVDKGDPKSSQPSQRRDHVRIDRDGQVLGPDGKPVDAPKPSKTEAAHIPLVDWLKW